MTATAGTYNHAFSLGFEIPGSTSSEGDDVTAEQLRDAIITRVENLMAAGALLEAVGCPDDSYAE